MITDSTNRSWTPSADRSLWKASDGFTLKVNPQSTDEQVLASIENILATPEPKTEADRIAELEAQVAALLASINNPSS